MRLGKAYALPSHYCIRLRMPTKITRSIRPSLQVCGLLSAGRVLGRVIPSLFVLCIRLRMHTKITRSVRLILQVCGLLSVGRVLGRVIPSLVA